MPTLHPQKQTVAISIVCLIAVAAVAIYAYGLTPLKEASNGQQISVSAETGRRQPYASSIGTSTDWKKQFFGNGPAGSLVTATRGSSTSSAEKLTETDQFSRDVFTQIVNLNQTGLIDDSAMVSTTVSDLLAKDYSGSDKPETYDIGDILIDPDDGTAALRAYGNAVGSLLQAHETQQDSAAIALAGLQGKDPSYVQELQANAAAYQAVLKGLLSIPAPESVSAYHLGLVNGASDMIYITSALSATPTDPMRAISALNLYQTAFTLGLQNLLMIRNTMTSAGIVYGDGEGGSFFFNFNTQKP